MWTGLRWATLVTRCKHVHNGRVGRPGWLGKCPISNVFSKQCGKGDAYLTRWRLERGMVGMHSPPTCRRLGLPTWFVLGEPE